MNTINPTTMRTLIQRMHHAAYGPGASLDDLHAAEDQAAAMLGVRVIRAGQADLVTPCQLHSMCYDAIKAAERVRAREVAR